MNPASRATPEGTRDLLFEECDCLDRVQGQLLALFKAWGFSRVQTPSLEFFDLFSGKADYFPQESLYKLTDSSGRLAVMRPDCTIPIARLAASRLLGQPLPLRLCYAQNIFRLSPNMSGRCHEINQIGVEVMGVSSAQSDLELLQLAAEALAACSGDSFRLELCHIGYFKALLAALQTDDATAETIRGLIESKNYAALGDVLSRFNGSPAAKALKALPRLFGGEEVFDKALALFSSPEAAAPLADLRSLYQKLSALGLEGRIMVDLGLVNQADYYTGIIFKGYLEGVGQPVLSGGRYDNLVQAGGRALPSTGFGINLDLVVQKRLAEHPVSRPCCQLLVYAQPEYRLKGLQYAQQQRRGGLNCETALCDSLEQALDYARKRGIPRLDIVGEQIESREVQGL